MVRMVVGRTVLCLACLLCLPGGPGSSHAATAAARDQGPVAIGDSLAMTVYLQPRDIDALERFDRALQDPGDRRFHRFLTLQSFVARYAPTDAQLAMVEATLRQLGYTIGTVFPNHLALQVTATAGTAQRSFGLALHRFTLDGRTGTESLTAPTIPSSLSPLLRGIGGYDTLQPLHSGELGAPTAVSEAPTARSAGPVGASGNSVGHYAPSDFEARYDVTPLVAAGATGRGTTIGIVTLSNFAVADAAQFWSGYGITVGADHLTKIDVDGGTDPKTPYSDGDPSESDLDVEQSGAIAPQARVLAYVAPNRGNATFLDGFEAAASDNLADVVSCSWGKAESAFYANDATGTPARTFYLDAFHDVFLEMAAQGQTVFTDADDNGAFEINRFDYPVFDGSTQVATPFYSIHHPSSDPLVTAAGGTTVPFAGTYSGLRIDIAQEQAWSWSYFPLAALAQGGDVAKAIENDFAVGGGGGVSLHFGVPPYQRGLAGIRTTQPNQALYEIAADGTRTLVTTAPAGFAGRNIPDLSADADPDTGYTSVVSGTLRAFRGGTSFVAPQFAGTTALLVEKLGHRLGQLNPLLYRLQKQGAPPARDIASGDNWGYLAQPGYDQTTGLGVMDAARLFDGLAGIDRTAR